MVHQISLICRLRVLSVVECLKFLFKWIHCIVLSAIDTLPYISNGRVVTIPWICFEPLRMLYLVILLYIPAGSSWFFGRVVREFKGHACWIYKLQWIIEPIGIAIQRLGVAISRTSTQRIDG